MHTELLHNVLSTYPTISVNNSRHIIREKINRLFENGKPMSKIILEHDYGIDCDYSTKDDGNEGFTIAEFEPLPDEEALEIINEL